MREDFNDEIDGVRWLNEPEGLSFVLGTGSGQGFSLVKDRPRIEEAGKKPASRADAWSDGSWLIASPAFVDILRRFDAGAVETVDIDWTFADGKRLDGYVFLDVTRRIYAYDYARTAAVVEMKEGEKVLARLGHPRALKPNIEPTVHLFRDAFHRSEIFMSRVLAKAIADAGLRGILFEDPVSGDTVTL